MESSHTTKVVVQARAVELFNLLLQLKHPVTAKELYRLAGWRTYKGPSTATKCLRALRGENLVSSAETGRAGARITLLWEVTEFGKKCLVVSSRSAATPEAMAARRNAILEKRAKQAKDRAIKPATPRTLNTKIRTTFAAVGVDSETGEIDTQFDYPKKVVVPATPSHEREARYFLQRGSIFDIAESLPEDGEFFRIKLVSAPRGPVPKSKSKTLPSMAKP